MASGHNDPKLLYAITGINAYHIENGKEECLTPAGSQTLSLLMVPTSSPSSGLSSSEPQSQAPEEDFYLHLHLPPALDLPLPATTQVYHQPPSSYLIPRWDMGPESGAFTRIEFPSMSQGGSQEDVDTFETILAQCTAFLERAQPPKSAKASKAKGEREKARDSSIPAYDPGNFQPGEAYVPGSSSSVRGGQIVLIDEENGSVVGELGEGFQVIEDIKMKPGSKEPVEITLPQDGSQNIGVAPASEEYLEMAMHPAYKNSTLVSKAAMASRLIVTTTGFVSKTMQSSADSFTQKTKPNAKPMTFTPASHERIRKVHTFTEGAAGLSAKTVGQVGKYAQNFGATIAKRSSNGKAHKGIGPDGQPVEGYKPGLLNKSLMAFSTIADGIDQAGRNLLTSTSTAATTAIGHKYGAEAGQVSRNIGGGFKNVGLVYIDATGVSRRAIVKSVAKGMVVGKVRGGGDLVVGGGDGGGQISQAASRSGSRSASPAQSFKEKDKERFLEDASVMSGGRRSPDVVGYGRQAPPAYGAGPGESFEGQFVPDQKRRDGY
ncbi:senescence-associated protein-domain-containing protein [Amylocarpus encephaloides]|uniref:Senescence-associated protein-domain-containing protein n=1 Tax=Amylocarpus encephaloides TaxID=45428 RepID=A0A9P8C1T2_9HELO|nr:senescence-associated protein-domain-containing protein [Amylocarpus encephaloides]